MFVNNNEETLDLEIYQSRDSKLKFEDAKGFIGSILELEFITK